MTAVNFSWWAESEGGESSRVRFEDCGALKVGMTKSSEVSISTEGDMAAAMRYYCSIGRWCEKVKGK
jgi:hypothetical protein